MILGNLFYDLKDKSTGHKRTEETNIPVEKIKNKNKQRQKLSNNQIGLQINLLVLTRPLLGPIL